MYAKHHEKSLLPDGEGVVASSFEALAEIAAEGLGGATGHVMVCGPITTGGTGNQTHNFLIMNAVVRGLKRRGRKIFDQLPYERGLRRLIFEWENAGHTGYCWPILDVFYTRVFGTGSISEGWFIPGWKSSVGATWEREQLEARGCIIHDLTFAEIREFLVDECAPELIETIMSELAEGVDPTAPATP